MKRQELLQKFETNHQWFVNYINSLTDDEFVKSRNAKWTPGQQLEHIFKCNQPLAYILNNKMVIEQKFGKINRPTLSYDEILKNYAAALANGGKAPEKFVPEETELNKKKELIDKVLQDVKVIIKNFDNYSDDELNSLILPHPLLGNLTIMEMMYLMTYHVKHHHEITKENLKNTQSKTS